MPVASKAETSRMHHPREASFVSVLSGWAQQGVQSLFATQRILLDLAMRQNANIMHAVREQLTDPQHSPTAILSEVAGEGVNNFLEGQKILLEMGKQQNDVLVNSVRERIGESPAAHAFTDLLERSVDTFIHMQMEFLKIAGKQTHTWLDAAKAGKPYEYAYLTDLAREAMENFAKAQKQFLDVVAEETAKATHGKKSNGARKPKKTELSEVARQTMESLIEAQKRLVDLAGKQMNNNVKTVGQAFERMPPFQVPPLGELTREAVKSYVDAQKALMEVMVKPVVDGKHAPRTEHHPKRAKKATAGSVA